MPKKKSIPKEEQETSSRRCPECGSGKIGRENEEYFCEKCGFVLED